MNETTKKRRRFFGADIDLLTMGETLDAVRQIIDDGTPQKHVAINVAKLVSLQKNAALRSAVNRCSLISVDGQGVVWAAKLFGINIPERVAGIDLFESLIAIAADNGLRPYFLGATDDVVRKAVDVFRARHPTLDVAGFRSGYFSEDKEHAVAEAIRTSDADLLFVAISSPKKEFFLDRNFESMNVPFVMGVGGSFDIFAGKTLRAPQWMQRFGLEWLYRLLAEPRRMWKRYLSSNSAFAWMIFKALILGKRRYDID